MSEALNETKDRLQLIKDALVLIYSGSDAVKAYEKIMDLINKYKKLIEAEPYTLTQKDIILITYGNQIFHEEETALATLKRFLDEYVEDYINTVHILPFYPYSSDDGFSIVNYKGVSPLMGSWRDIKALSKDHRLMFDGVINHISQLSEWFNKYLANHPNYLDFFIELDPSTDLSAVVRPRTIPLLSEYTDDEGKKRSIWTTFSRDQVDLNYANYKVLIKILDVLLFYVQHGASLLRLDAIAFIWKEVGTKCVHLPQTHALIQLMRQVIHEVAPEVLIITETNVPHDENISYFGEGDDEAQMVYNFALPPLLAFSILKGDTTKLTQWAKGLKLPSDKVCFFNFTASHDGVGLRAVSDILTHDEIEFLVESCLAHNGLVSYRAMNGGDEKAPYELNSSYIDILTHPDAEQSLRVKRMMLSQAVTLTMPGVPGIYFHSLVGSESYFEGAKKTRRNRAINREKLNFDNVKEELEDENGLRNSIFKRYKQLISIRINEKAFDPYATFETLELGNDIFAIKHFSRDKSEAIITLYNFSDRTIEIDISDHCDTNLLEIITHKPCTEKMLTIEAYGMLWLKQV
ncbi:sugar phosphorylase [Sulfurimonas marina]|uniref:Sugar phosphorylase n=1 Tax=Sulfurimonas marina TaxID=2590551 RepID=A0A7M1AVK2_9BACT|nr:sugar phosphorylase [Sulfurimonas marina]QOP41416.1 sugar phosphorylase [Sulfurimonas marina]